jgi:hypothetical protein
LETWTVNVVFSLQFVPKEKFAPDGLITKDEEGGGVHGRRHGSLG